ncbi:MAG TPA: response regulator, partial [Pirellula sp.]|nr:response regulator [Pirellula sp.]
MRLLVVDDDPDIVTSLRDRFVRMGHTVSSASDGRAAVISLESDPVDLVFMDVDMPKLNGVETLRLTKKRWPELPVIIMTGYSTVQLAVTAMQAGATEFITKPLKYSQLDATITKAMERHAITNEITRMLGTVSHDIKNLLQPIVSGTDLLSGEIEDLFRKLPEMESVKTQESHLLCDEVIAMLRTASNRIQIQMKEIADYVRVTQAPHRFVPCQIAKIAKSVATTLGPLVRQKNITFRLEGLDSLPPIIADETRLYSTFYNL